jgi:hypothetical protein
VTPQYNMLASVVPVGRFLVQAQHLVVALSHLAVYDSGCMLEVRISGRTGGPGPQIHSCDAFESLVFAARFGEEITAVLDGWHHVARNRGWLQLSYSGAQCGESASRAAASISLWLHPLPPPQAGILTILAPDLGHELTDCPLDGVAIVAAAKHARPYWH